VERFTYQSPVAANSIHTFAKARLEDSVCCSSSSLSHDAAPHLVPLQLRLQIRSFYFWTYTSATDSNVNKDAPADTSTGTTTSNATADSNKTVADYSDI
jgi:hypothetical protein